MDLPLTIAEAAAILEVTPDAVRKLATNGTLIATKHGRDWAIDPSSVERRRRGNPVAGRPLSRETAWGVILEASAAPRIGAAWEVPARDRGRRWLARYDLVADAARLRNRARLERFDVHPSQRKELLESSLATTGISAARTLGLTAGPDDQVEIYALAKARHRYIREFGLVPADGPVTIRWIAGSAIHAAMAMRSPTASDAVPAPRAAVLLDLLDSDDPRARREAARALAAQKFEGQARHA